MNSTPSEWAVLRVPVLESPDAGAKIERRTREDALKEDAPQVGTVLPKPTEAVMVIPVDLGCPKVERSYGE